MVAVLLLLLGFLPTIKGELLGKLCDGNSPGELYNEFYHYNLLVLSATLPNDTSSSQNLSAKGSVGVDQGTMYGLALCRGDANSSVCGDCISAAFEAIQQGCTNNTEMVVFYDLCLLSLSDQDLTDAGSYSEIVYGVINTMNTTEAKLPGWDHSNGFSISQIVQDLLLETSMPPAYVYPARRYVTAFMDATVNNPLLYSMAQCMPDLISNDCWNCLTNITEIAMASFAGQQRGGVFTVRCVLRYDTNVFYSGKPMLLIGPAAVSESTLPSIAMPKLKHTTLNEMATSNTEFGLIRRQTKALNVDPQKGPQDKAKMNVEADADETLLWQIEGRVSEFKVYDFSQVMEATSNFSERNKLGQGGFGPVYKIQ
nr:unnamed protein product [Digitaria exilis]